VITRYFAARSKRLATWLGGIAALALVSWQVAGQGALVAIAPVALPSQPLNSAPVGDKPTLTLVLSLGPHAASAQYRDPQATSADQDKSYSNSTEYLGYWDANSCYHYHAPGGTDTAQNPHRFVRSAAAPMQPPAERTCADAFSGNFLNWAVTSSLDVVRMALTGGDRIADTADTTVLQRAVLPPEGSPVGAGEAPYQFPIKLLLPSGGASGRPYFGAVPQEWVARGGGVQALVVRNMGNQWEMGSASLSAPIGASNSLANAQHFYARVEVCAQDAQGQLLESRPWPRCQRQPSGHYKPTGVLQAYAERLRVAVFTALAQADPALPPARYGAALRAPLQYIGARSFDPLGHENTPASGNPTAEWDAHTGVLRSNPLGLPQFGLSGVINTINRLGRNGQYPSRNALGEMHLEALRYLQGQQPSLAAVDGLDGRADNRVYGGLPAYTRWADPYAGRDPSADHSCQRAHLLVLGAQAATDHAQRPAPNPAMDLPDIGLWSATVRHFETQALASYTDVFGTRRTTTGRLPGPNAVFPGPDGAYRLQLYGSAYWARSQDIRDLGWDRSGARSKAWRGLRVRTMVVDTTPTAFQEADHDNNALFMAAKYGGYATDASDVAAGVYNAWGNPFVQSGDGGASDMGQVTPAMGPRADYIWASAQPGREGVAQTYFRAAARPLDTLRAFEALFAQALAAPQSGASGTVASTTLTAQGSMLYRSVYDSSDWQGDVLAYPIKWDAQRGVTFDNMPLWSAAAQLRSLPDADRSRNIAVGVPGSGALQRAVEFRWAALPPVLQQALGRAHPGAVPDALGPERVSRLRGQRLGDVIRSEVVYSGAPAPGQFSVATYAAFAADHAQRRPVVLVGANDGMLHAFDAASGNELFAYIPSWLVPHLPALLAPNYAENHRAYVDATPTVAQAELRSGWATVLVSGTGAGGKGVFALDVTHPSAFSADKVLWEFTSADDPDFDLGHVMARPQVLKLRTSAASAQRPTYRWFAVVGNGVNSYLSDAGAGASRTGMATLYFLDLSKPAGQPWLAGQNYFKVSFPTQHALQADMPTGLVDFSAVLDAQQAVSVLYAGDLHGQLWKLDFSRAASADWQLMTLSAFHTGTAAARRPVPWFTAQDAQGRAQPITLAPSVSPGAPGAPRLVVFGTGKLLEAADVESTGVQTLYLLQDNGLALPNTAEPSGAIVGRGRLEAVTLRPPGVNLEAPTQPSEQAAPGPIAPGPPSAGWYFDFSAAGERLAGPVRVLPSQLLFTSVIPQARGSTGGVCRKGEGTGFHYLLDMATGQGLQRAVRTGPSAGLLLLDVPEAARSTAPDSAGRRTKTVVRALVQQGPHGVADGADLDFSVTQRCPADMPPGLLCTQVNAGVLSWRQISNYTLQRAAAW
jgi:type IV pilus assembly protein PilY1